MEDRKICNDKHARQTKKVNRVMEKKALYIRLDSSPLPKKSDRIIVKDFNLENYFCALLGKKLLEDHTIIQSILYPGKIVSDFRSSSIKSYNAIIKQWELLLVKLLSGNNKEECFILKIPSSYFEWLSHQEDKIYSETGNSQSYCLPFLREFLYAELIKSILLKRIEHTLGKINEVIDLIVIGLRYRQRLIDEKQLSNYIKPLNSQLEKLTVIHRKDFYIDTRKVFGRFADFWKTLK